MTWLYLYFTASTEARFRGAFTTACLKGNIKLYQKRTTKIYARTVNNDMPNVLRKKLTLFVMRQIILKNINIPRMTNLLMIKTQNRIKTRQKGKMDRRLVKKISMFSKRGKFENMKEVTIRKG